MPETAEVTETVSFNKSNDVSIFSSIRDESTFGHDSSRMLDLSLKIVSYKYWEVNGANGCIRMSIVFKVFARIA